MKQPPRQPAPRPRGPGGGSGGCLAAETTVSTPDGQRKIETLKSGDCVSTPNGVKSIVEVRQHYRDNLVSIDVGDGDSICCSAEHPFLASNGELVEAQLLEEKGEFPVNNQGEKLLTKITQMAGGATVYELILESSDSIFIGRRGMVTRPTKENIA